jgi:hypothetical protein
MWKKWISGWAVLGLAILSAPAMATSSYTAVFLPTGGYPDTEAIGFLGDQIVGDSNIGGDALLWPTIASNPTNLNPAGYSYASLVASDSDSAVGMASMGGYPHAALWENGGNTFTDLNPLGYTSSTVNGVANDQEVGFGSGLSTNGLFHALLWHGTSNTPTDLQPQGYYESSANAINGIYQVGSATTYNSDGSIGEVHAAVWSGSAATFLDINPIGALASSATSIDGDLVGGYASFTTGNMHALLWNLSTGANTDLNPAGVSDSFIGAIAGDYEVGDVVDPAYHATLWQGTASGAVNLETFLPPGCTASNAYAVDINGDVFGDAVYNGVREAVVWIAPEPSTLLLAIMGLMVIVPQRQNR